MTKTLMLLLLPLLLAAQVSVDTVVKLPYRAEEMLYVPTGNKLYMNTRDHVLLVLDCETYQTRGVIATGHTGGVFMTWNWRRNKVYCVFNYPWPESIAVIDATADTLLKWIPFDGVAHPAYVSSKDQVYVSSRTISVIDCATDSIVKVFPPYPYEQQGSVSWDSIGNKVYVPGDWFHADILLAYSCDNDSFLAEIPVGTIPSAVKFYPRRRKGYVGPWSEGPVSVFDCAHDILIRTYDFYQSSSAAYPRGAIDTTDDKFYAVGGYGPDDTLYVIDCATDSITKRIPLSGAYPDCYWVPWSNHLHIPVYCYPDRWLTVLDCPNDSIVVPRLDIGSGPIFLAINETNQRVYVTCCPDSALYVLRDDPPGVQEDLPAGVVDAVGPTIVSRSVTLLGTEPAELLDIAGRKRAELQPGLNRLELLPAGIYFVRRETGTRVQRIIIPR